MAAQPCRTYTRIGLLVATLQPDKPKGEYCCSKGMARQISSNETIPDDIVIFQDGKVVKMSELQPEGGPIWEEVSKCCTFRAVISVNTGVTRSLLRTTSWTAIGSVLHIISRHQVSLLTLPETPVGLISSERATATCTRCDIFFFCFFVPDFYPAHVSTSFDGIFYVIQCSLRNYNLHI